MEQTIKTKVEAAIARLVAKRTAVYAELAIKGDLSWAKQAPAREITKNIEKLERFAKNGVADPAKIKEDLEKATKKVEELTKKLEAANNGGVDEEIAALLEEPAEDADGNV